MLLWELYTFPRMNKWLEYLYKLPEVFKYILLAGVVIFISFLFPDNASFKYDFHQGQTWKYSDLYAPYDFDLLKSTEEIDKEKEEVLSNTPSLYVKKNRTEAEIEPKVEGVITALTAMATASETAVRAFRVDAKASLESHYGRGVLSDSENITGERINLFRNGKSESLPVKGFSSVEKSTKALDALVKRHFGLLSDDYSQILVKAIQPNVIIDTKTDSIYRAELIQNISPVRGTVKRGELLAMKDGIVTQEIYEKLDSFKSRHIAEASASGSSTWVFLGYLLLTSLIIGVYVLYLKNNSPKVFEKLPNLLFVLLWVVVFSYLVFAIEKTETLSSYVIPFCIVPIVMLSFFEARLAFFTHVIIVLIASFLSKLGYEFTFLQMLAGAVAVLSVKQTRYWNKFFISISIIIAAYALGYFGLSLIQEGDLWSIDYKVYIWFLLNAIFLLLAYPLIPLLERLFGFTSSITLSELQDMNNALLKELSLKAPGTWQHSIQVSNLAEAAAAEIGADTTLIKTAALYHDIGKMKEPELFIENQRGNNPHMNLSYFESAKRIIDHVPNGVEMAKKARLPKIVIDFITTHHGTTRTEYFYRKQLADFPNQEFDESLFRYPGPIPRSKEETIMMLADSLEAASKSLKNPVGKDIDELVDNIIKGKIDQGQLVDSNLNYQELEICKGVFKNLLRSIYHVRVEYPEEVQPSPTTGVN